MSTETISPVMRRQRIRRFWQDLKAVGFNPSKEEASNEYGRGAITIRLNCEALSVSALARLLNLANFEGHLSGMSAKEDVFTLIVYPVE